MLLTWTDDSLKCDSKVVHANFSKKLAIIKKTSPIGITHWCVVHGNSFHKGFDNPAEAKELYNKLSDRFSEPIIIDRVSIGY